MYGTIARLHIRPGMHEAFMAWASTTTTMRMIPGHMESLVYQMDADPSLLTLVVIFKDRDSYQANASSPEQHAEYLTMMEFLTEEPEWNDGDIIWRG
ncbi:MAG: hypothetical protein U0452_06650 [Anaerolineae bacterium]